MKKLNNSSLGIDISKQFLDIHHLPSNLSKKYENTPQGIKLLLKWMSKNYIESVIFEPTGGYEKPLIRYLQKKDYRIPSHTRIFKWQVRPRHT